MLLKNRIFYFVHLIILSLITVTAAFSSDLIENRFIKPSMVIEATGGTLYAAAPDYGFLFSADGGNKWERRNTGLPSKIVYPFDQDEIETLTSISYDPADDGRIACTTAYGLFLSSDRGMSWKAVPLGDPIARSNYLTSVSLNSEDHNRILIATSFSGIFETTDSGKTWKEIAEKEIIYRGAGFNEEIAAAFYVPGENGALYVAYSFGNGLYKSDDSRKTWSMVSGFSETKSMQNAYFISTGRIRIDFGSEQAEYFPEDDTWSDIFPDAFYRAPAGPARAARLDSAADHTGLYIGPGHTTGQRLENHLDFMERNGLDSIVIDIKDDFGYLTYDSRLDFPLSIGAVKKRTDLDYLINRVHERGFYVIGRIVVFKDQQLFNYSNHKYALWDKYSDEPWRYLIKIVDDDTGEVSYEQREYWVDPFNPAVWKYNADIAEELQERGVDEIQFDYIRFPSDGNTSRIKFNAIRPGMTRINALESFFRLIRERIHVPISTDLYGFNTYYRMGNWIGQNIEMLADYVDVICPMYYPSHFPRNFMRDVPYIERAGKIYNEGTLRAAEITEGRSLIRPYVQAFLLPSEYYMEEEDYHRYLLIQLEACREAESSGWSLWNMSNRYYMVPEPLGDYLK